MEKFDFDSQLETIKNTFLELDALKDFYIEGYKQIQDLEKKTDTNYKIGIQIDKYFKAILAEESIEKRNKLVDDFPEFELAEGIFGKDVLTFSKEDIKKEGISFTYNGKYSRKNDVIGNAKLILSKRKSYRRTLESSTLTRLVCIFENFLYYSFGELMVSDLKSYIGSKTIKLADVFDGKSNEKINSTINTELKSQLYDSIKGLKYFSKKENLNIENYDAQMKKYIEINLRRNVHVHNNGIVNDIYISECEKYGIEVSSKRILNVSSDYLDDAIDAIKELVLIISTKIICEKEIDEEHFSSFEPFLFNELSKGGYYYLLESYRLLSKYEKFNLTDQGMFWVNYLICIKGLRNDEETLKKGIKMLTKIASEDVSYKIAMSCLSEDFSGMLDMLSDAFTSKKNECIMYL